jgi:hypothetical protein
MMLLNSIVLAQSKFSLGLFFVPECSYISGLPYSGKLKATYSSGIDIRYQLSKKISLTSGLQISNKGYTTMTIDAGVPAKQTWSYKYFEIPALLSYQFSNSSRVTFYPSIGLILGSLINQRVTIAPNKNNSGGGYYLVNRRYLDGFNKYILSGYIGMGGMVKISKKLSLLVQPNIKYSLTSMHKMNPRFSIDSPYSNHSHHYSLGIVAEVFYNF